MIQIFIKIPNEKTFILNLEKNYTISSQELLVKSILQFYLSKNLNIKNVIDTNQVDFFTNLYAYINNKIIRFSDLKYYNTSDFDKYTLNIHFIINFTLFDEETIQLINNIIDGYY